MPRQEPPENDDYYYEPTHAAPYRTSTAYGDPYVAVRSRLRLRRHRGIAAVQRS